MPASGNDFFLEFTTNAEEFGTGLASKLNAPIEKIEELRKALVAYDEQVQKMGARGPLANQFAGLNQAATRMQVSTDKLVTTVASALNGLETKITGLAEVLASATRSLGAQPEPEAVVGTGPRGYILSEAEERAIQLRREKEATQSKAVNDADLTAAKTQVAAAGKTAEASEKVAKESGDLATNINSIVTSIKELAERLKGVEIPATGTRAAGQTEVTGEVHVGNTPSNPVPVTIVGGEPVNSGHAGGKEPTPRATTATQNAKAVEALAQPVPLRPRTGEQWDALSPAYRARLLGAGVTRESYLTGSALAAARGHSTDVAIGAANASGAGAGASAVSNAEAAALLGSGSEPVVNKPRTAKPRTPKVADLAAVRSEISAIVQSNFDALNEITQGALNEIRAKLFELRGRTDAEAAALRVQLIGEGGAHLLNDPKVRQGPNRESSVRDIGQRGALLAGSLGYDPADPATGLYFRKPVLGSGGTAAQAAGVLAGKDGPAGPNTAAVSSERDAAAVRMREVLATSSGKVQRALIGEVNAQLKLNELRAGGVASDIDLARAEYELAQASEASAAAQRGTIDQFSKNLGRTGGWALRHMIAFSLVFTGFEKLKEVIHTGLEAQSAMVRLNNSLVATGKSTSGVAESMAKISASTGTPIQHVIDAATELQGVFKTTADVEFATKIASQLSTISNGALTATQAAIGLRDVVSAFNFTSQSQVQNFGDIVARLHQTTGVNVKDITEGSTQLAQQANDFGLTPRQTATLSAYITQNTGETGEAAAEQATRLFETLNKTNVQSTLVRTGVTDQSKFLQGNMAGVIEDLVTKWDSLNPASKQSISNLMGSGRQARVFAGVTSGGQGFINQFTGNAPLSESGVLQTQSSQIMRSLLGQTKRLSEDFQNLGLSIERSGLLDLFGALIAALDGVAKGVRWVIDEFTHLTDATHVSHDIAHVGVMLLELWGVIKLLGRTDVGTGIAGYVRSVPARATALYNNEKYVGADKDVSAETAHAQSVARDTDAISKHTQALLRLSATTKEDTAATQADSRAKIADAKAGEADAVAQKENAAASRRGGLSNSALFSGPRGRTIGMGIGAGVFIGGGLLGDYLSSHGHKALGGAASGAATGALLGSFVGPEGTIAGAAIGGIIGGIGNRKSAGDRLFTNLNTVADAGNAYTSIAGGGAEDAKSAIDDTTKQTLEKTKLTEKAKAAGVSEAELTKAITGSGKEFDNVVAKWKAGGSPAQNTILTLEALRVAYEKSGAAAAAHAEAVAQANGVMNQSQATLAQNYASVVGTLSPDTLRQNPDALKAILSNSGTVVGTKEYSAAATLAGFKYVTGQGLVQDDNVGPVDQARAQQTVLNKALVTQTSIANNTDPITGKQGSYNADQIAAAQTAIGSLINSIAQARQTELQSPIQTAQSKAQYETGIGDSGAAAGALTRQKGGLQTYLSTLLPKQQEFWSTLSQIKDVQLQIAQAVDTPARQAAQIQAANSLNPMAAARAQQDLAVLALKEAEAAYQAELTDARNYIAEKEKTLAAIIDNMGPMASRDPQYAKLLDAIRSGDAALKALVATGGNTPEKAAAQAQNESANATAAQTQEAIDAARAQANMAGIRNAKQVAQAQLAEALRQEAVYSSQGNQAAYYGAIAQATQAEIAIKDAIEQQKEAALTATSALAQSRGDVVRAAKIDLAKAQQAYAYAVQQYGKDSEQAQSALATVYQQQRSAFDTALQAQMDTLDFQRETYKITSAQEVQSLQQILKNKQLTLKEQRDITLKIKGLQESIRQQLTEGGLNIPSDIKLPTAYEVRRSLGAGFAGSGTSVSTVNNNQQVTINNQVTSSALVQQITNSVINAINTQTAQQLRSNTSTPRLVTTR